jgi:metallophosphoesterase superfamily enzyme
MPHVVVHLSDIHFGQEKGGDIHVHDDIKEQILVDVREVVAGLPNGSANGVIISGDIAYAGKATQYDEAGRWLDRLTAAVGCEVTAVQVVPGNHDVDRDEITAITQTVIDRIIEKGDDELDRYMEKEQDREFIYRQFEGYRKFAEGYNCPLDSSGVVKVDQMIELAPGKKLRFWGVNTALICSKSKKEEGGLMLGKRQRIIPQQDGVETVVIAHHPLNWLQDSQEARLYIENRARVFISGHEHKPSHQITTAPNSSQLLMLASGAAVPPGNEGGFGYCYNVLQFEWIGDLGVLRVTIVARMWQNQLKAFGRDTEHFKDGMAVYDLPCPNFSSAKKQVNVREPDITRNPPVTSDCAEMSISQSIANASNANSGLEEREYKLLLLRFFRDLSSTQRISILIELGALPLDLAGSLTHAMERRAFDKLHHDGRIEELHEKINQHLQQNQ